MSNNYWIDRFEKEEEIINNLSKRHIKLAHKQYDRALRNINRKIYEWYGKYAKNNNISFSQAKEELSISDLKDLKMSLEEYIEKGESLNIKKDEKVLRDMINASTRVHIDKLESLKLQIKAEINLLTKNMETITENHLSEVFQDTYYRTAYITQFGIKHFEDINRLNPELIKGFIHKPWTSDNVNWSKRLWGHDNRISNMIHEGLSQNIVAGISLDKIIDNIADRFNTEKHIASRLVMTESAAYHSRAKEQCFKDLDIERYQIVATLDNKTSNICREMDGKIFFMKDYQVGITAPPFHANCRTVTAPYYEDIEGDKNTRAARNEKENYQEVEDISYKEWFEKYVKDEKENDIIKEKDELYGLSKKSPRKKFAEKLLSNLDLSHLEVTVKEMNARGSCGLGFKSTDSGKLKLIVKTYNLEKGDNRKRRYQLKTVFHEAYHALGHNKEVDFISPEYHFRDWAYMDDVFAECSAHYMMKRMGNKIPISPSYPDYLMKILPKLKKIEKFKGCKTIEDFGEIAWKAKLAGENPTWITLKKELDKINIDENYYKSYLDYARNNKSKIQTLIKRNVPNISIKQIEKNVEKALKNGKIDDNISQLIIANVMKLKGVR